MVEYLQKEIRDIVKVEDCNRINWEVTEQISKEPKYVKFNEWL